MISVDRTPAGCRLTLGELNNTGCLSNSRADHQFNLFIQVQLLHHLLQSSGSSESTASLLLTAIAMCFKLSGFQVKASNCSRLMVERQVKVSTLYFCSSASVDSQLEELKQETVHCKSHMIEMEKRLKVFEGDPSEISTLCEAQYREEILEQTLKHVRARKHVLEKYNSPHAQSTSQVALPPGVINLNNMVPSNSSNVFDWLRPRDPQVQIMNFMNFSGLFPPRQNEHANQGSVLEPDDTANVQRSEFGQMIDMNLSPWTLYPTEKEQMGMPHPGERAFSETFLP